MLVEDETYFLEAVFNHIPGSKDKPEVYWRDCIKQDGMYQGEQGYLIYWPETGTVHHTYRYPPDWMNV